MVTDEVRCKLVTRARAGDSIAVGALLEACRPALVNFLNRRLPPYLRTQVAEEIVQDAYDLAWRKLPGFDWRDLLSTTNHLFLICYVIQPMRH